MLPLSRLASSMFARWKLALRTRRDRIKIGVSGRIALEVVHADGSVDRHDGGNLVVTAGITAALSRLFNSGGAVTVWEYIAVGTGTSAAAAGDTALQTELVRQIATYATVSSTSISLTTTFAAGVAEGDVTEAGTLNDVAAGTLWNRKVFAAVPVGPSDVLRVICTVTMAPAA